MEAAALRDLDARLAALPEDADAEAIQTEVYEVGKAHPFESLRDWFKALYETLLGTSQGPRMGSFIALYGIANSRKLIAEALGRASLISGAGAAVPGSRAASGSRVLRQERRIDERRLPTRRRSCRGRASPHRSARGTGRRNCRAACGRAGLRRRAEIALVDGGRAHRIGCASAASSSISTSTNAAAAR